MAGNKYISVGTSGRKEEVAAIQTSAGAGDAGKIPALDASGKFDASMMPASSGADTKVVLASENLAAGDMVNIYDNAGTENCRKADASAASAGKKAHGFVLTAVTSGNNATVYLDGTNTQVTGLTAGIEYFLSDVTPGAVTATAVTTSGNTLQSVGFAESTTELSFEVGEVIIRA